MLGDYFFLALNNLRQRGLRSWLTMLGIFIGIAAVVSLISLGNGLEQAVIGQFGSLDTDKLTIQNQGTGFGPPGSTAPRQLTEDDMELIESVQGVDLAIPRLIRVVSVEYNDVVRFKGVINVPKEEREVEIMYDSVNAEIDQGRLITEEDRGKVIIGGSFATEEEFRKKIGVGTNLDINGESFEVIGILEKTGSFFIDSEIFMPEQDLRELLGLENEIDLIVAQVEDPDRIEQVAEEIERKLRKDRNQDIGEEDFSVQTPLQSLEAVSTILNIINLIVSGIAAVSLLIGGIGIANTMFTSVLERRKEIGIMKAIGAKNKDILYIFMLESALLGLVGGIVGAALGLALAFAVSSSASAFLGGINLQVTFSLPLILASISFSLLIGIFSGIVPAYQASKMNPVEALRK